MEIILGIVGVIICGMLLDFITAHWWAALIVGGVAFMVVMHPTLAGTLALLTGASLIYIAPVILIALLFFAWPKKGAT